MKRFLNFLENSFIVVGYILLFIITLVFLSFSLTHIALSAQLKPLTIYKNITDFTLSLLSSDVSKISKEQYASTISLMLNVLVVLVTLWFAVIPVLTYLKYRKNVRKSNSLKNYRVKKDGVDDINVMKKYYKGAQEIIIFSGDYSWLAESRNKEIADDLLRLSQSNDLKLNSYKTSTEVENAFNSFSNNNLFRQFASSFKFESGKRIKCSLVKYQGRSVFLYKFHNTEHEATKIYVSVLLDLYDSHYLLETLNALCQIT